MSDPSCVKELHSPRNEVLVSAFLWLRDDKMCRERVWKKWLPAETWVSVITMSGLIDTNVFTVDAAKFNRALSRSKGNLGGLSMDRFDRGNESGVFRVKFSKKYYYLLTDPQRGQAQPYPTMNSKWKESVDSEASDVLMHLIELSSIVARRYTRTTSSSIKEFLALSSSRLEHFTFNEEYTLPILPATMLLVQQDQEEDNTTVQEQQAPILPLILPVEQQQDAEPDKPIVCFWTSYDAFILFAGGSSVSYDEFMATNISSGKTVVDLLETHIAVLQAVSKKVDGWRDVVKGRDADDVCSETEIFNLKSRAMTLCAAYQNAILYMNSWSWEQCCSEACKQLNKLGVLQATIGRTVRDWNLEFRKQQVFLHPNLMVRCGQRPLPLMLVRYPAAKDQMAAFGLSNLSTLTVETMRRFCIDDLFPKLFLQFCTENTADAYRGHHVTESVPTMANFLQYHGIRTFAFSTCLKWMKLIGFTYSHQRKSYYVDGHERDDVVDSRRIFCCKYLTEIEPRCLRWVQYDAKEIVAANLDPDFAYKYTDSDGNVFYEFHIDYCSRRQEKSTVNAMEGKVASMSVRAPPDTRPIECYGQDESLFYQFQFPSRSWVGPNSERALLPKSQGEGLMISAFVSRDTGFGMQLTTQELEKINNARQGTHYIDRTAAIEVNKHSLKRPLTQSPFVRDLLVGATKGGYWNGFHMALQLEDIVDVLRIVRPQFDWIFFFDHSQGHARKQDGALDAQMMSRSFGGKQTSDAFIPYHG